MSQFADGMFNLDDALGQYRSGYGLPNFFYTSEDIFNHEIAHIFSKHWFFAGHSIEFPLPYNFFTLNIANIPLLIIRDQLGTLKAFHNICPHRGSLLCHGECGKFTRIVCPYHGWSFALDGTPLRENDSNALAGGCATELTPVHVGEFQGLIFVSLTEYPTPLSDISEHFSSILSPHCLSAAKIACIRDYVLNVNWKIVQENNRECYHCPKNHHGYVSIQYDTVRNEPSMQHEINVRLDECRERWSRLGLQVDRVNTSSKTTATWFRANRTPTRRGKLTESHDGQLVSSVLMGGLSDPDMGTARLNTNINFWCHANSDYAHTVRITPVSATKTIVRGYWMVSEAAEEGLHYTADAVADFHHRVMEEDWELLRMQWPGITSPFYKPGRLSREREETLIDYLDWYIDVMKHSRGLV